MTESHWLSILGIGEDGIAGLGGQAHDLLAQAALVVGGARHLRLGATLITGDTMTWPRPIEAAFAKILERRGTKVAVLASGDPMFHGVGTHLARLVEPSEFICLPVASCVSLAAARLGWPIDDTPVISCCGWPVARLIPRLHDGARLFVLSADATTPGAIAALLRARGFAGSTLHLLEALGGPHARHRRVTAADELPDDIAPLNLVAIAVRAGPDAQPVPHTGLPDAAFAHDGQITKSEVRAATLAALAPAPGSLLWDIGCGSGSIAIEWLLRHPANRAIGFERDPLRAERARANATALGLELTVIVADAPAILNTMPDPPDAVFIGGGAHHHSLIDTGWNALRPTGRLVINAVTIETEAALFDAHSRLGGTLTRIAIERLDQIGRFHGFRPAMAVTQWRAVKP